MPKLDGAILFLEEVSHSSLVDVYEFDRNLQSIIQEPGFKKVRAIVLGRFEKTFGMTEEKLQYVLSTKPALKNIPIIANADFRHTTPIFTFPIGGVCRLQADKSGNVSLTIKVHEFVQN